jgi:hypothetical protein
LIVPPWETTGSEPFWYDFVLGLIIYQEMSGTAAAFSGGTPEITVGGDAVSNGVIQ